LPELLIKTCVPAMEVVRSIIRGEWEFTAIEVESCSADPPRDATHEGSKKGVRVQVILELVETKYDIDLGLISPRHSDRSNNAAIVRDIAR
jgi:hypothetical protein